jgi:glycosyltransferase involved in cell wall biosynthesis
MKGAFFYDGPLTYDNNGNYYGIALTNQLFSRYHNLCDSLEIIIRGVQLSRDEAKQYSKIDTKLYKIQLCPNISSAKGQILGKRIARQLIINKIREVDIVIVRLPSLIGELAYTEASTMGKTILLELVGDPFSAYWSHSLKGKLIAPFRWAAVRKIVKNAPYVYYVTDKYLQSIYPTKGNSIGCSNVVLNQSDELIIRKRIEKIKNMPNELKIGTIGAINYRIKGQELVIKALAILKNEGLNIKYYLLGPGDNNYLEKIIRKYNLDENVIFLGSKTREEVFNWLDFFDIYIQPSKQEGLPRALIEAMSRGCPSIGTKVGGIPELIDENFIIPYRSPGLIVEAIKKMNESEMLKQAIRNFNTAKNYEYGVLDNKRKEFYRTIRESIINL